MFIRSLEDGIETLQNLAVHILQQRLLSVALHILLCIQYIKDRFVILVDQHDGTTAGPSMSGRQNSFETIA